MNEVIIETPKKYLGMLSLVDYYPVHGVSLRADNYYVVYNLKLKQDSKDWFVEGKYLNNFLATDTHLFITEIDIEIIDSFGKLNRTILKQINLKDRSDKVLSSLEDGFVFPLKIEGDKIIYTKSLRENRGVTHEYEQTVTD